MANRYHTDNPDRKVPDGGARPNPGTKKGSSSVNEKTAGWGLKGLPGGPDRSAGVVRVKKYVKQEGL